VILLSCVRFFSFHKQSFRAEGDFQFYICGEELGFKVLKNNADFVGKLLTFFPSVDTPFTETEPLYEPLS